MVNYFNCFWVILINNNCLIYVGATHADELQYIMDQRIFYSDIEDNTEDDFMIGKVSEIWGNFAKLGEPLPHCWERLRKGEEKLKYYQISKKDCTVVEPFKERMNFWNGLKIIE
jgi:carboxylesterase type B